MRVLLRRTLVVASAGLLIASIAGPATAVSPTDAVDDDWWASGRIPLTVREGAGLRAGAAVGPAAFPGLNGVPTYNRAPDDADAWPASIYVDGIGDATTGGLGTGDGEPTWSPGGTRIAFSRDQTASVDDDVEDIWTMNPDGTGQVRLTNTSSNDIGPEWSPDGRRIAWASNRAGNYEIYSMRVDGSDVRRLTDNAAADSHPAWSPDGTKIAFASSRAGDVDIHVMNADGTNVVRLTTAAGLDLWPDWSPSGTQIAFGSDRAGDFDIFVMNANGSGQTNIVSDVDINDFTPAWQPDGPYILFDSDANATLDIFSVLPTGGPLGVLAAGPTHEYNPDWQPIPEFPLVDARFSPFRFDIEWLYGAGITSGCTAELFCADDLVTRGQMAAFLVRALGLPSTPTDYFTDDETSIFEADINKLAASGITTGCDVNLYCPDGNVTRGQMAAFLSRAYALPTTATDYFTDDSTSIFQANINTLAASGITSGCTATTYCPTANVTRGQMAAFLNRAEN